ncbi:MAG: cobalamin biosynthesis protein CobD [Desulfobacterales bacterium]|nr:cobalamin biosynthesis protein CobD [Desulfobacterales bacterium]
MTALYLSWTLIPLALAIDLAVGDPPWLPHPVRAMGWAASRLEPVFRRLQLPLELSGLLFAASLVSGCFLATLILVAAATSVHPLLGLILQILIIYFCLAPRCLYDEAMSVRNFLASGDTEKARLQIGMLVSRDVRTLDETGIARAGVETVAENFVDGVLSPLFYAAILGAPGAMAFKMASTLDSMVGYKNERYMSFGKASARLDDLLNWIPARLAIPVVAIAAQMMFHTGGQAFRTALREGKNHESPNAGRPEAAFAGALRVKINGPNIYHGQYLNKPWIGLGFNSPKPSDIEKAGQLMVLSSLIGLVLMVALYFLLRVVSC